MNHNKFNLMCEEDRLMFILHRYGLEETINTAKRLLKIYLQASLSTRQKFHTRNYPYRHSYLESAFSIRHLLHIKFLESVDVVVNK
jgi:hypothetical protein